MGRVRQLRIEKLDMGRHQPGQYMVPETAEAIDKFCPPDVGTKRLHPATIAEFFLCANVSRCIENRVGIETRS
jgi:hypothetical protein